MGGSSPGTFLCSRCCCIRSGGEMCDFVCSRVDMGMEPREGFPPLFNDVCNLPQTAPAKSIHRVRETPVVQATMQVSPARAAYMPGTRRAWQPRVAGATARGYRSRGGDSTRCGLDIGFKKVGREGESVFVCLRRMALVAGLCFCFSGYLGFFCFGFGFACIWGVFGGRMQD